MKTIKYAYAIFDPQDSLVSDGFSHSTPGKHESMTSCQPSPVEHLNKRIRACGKFWKLFCRLIAVDESNFIFPKTCIPIIAKIKYNIAISRQTYGNALKDCINVHNKTRIDALRLNNLISLAALNKRKKLRFIPGFCL